ncbi:MAG: tetratricopeptide repeat protein [Prevotella sp.]|nr:tetratricopeptide repeat protein [Prevotella sp.]MCI1282224.1 tetratricopeptide repeat protein [Prevotella sp.]
MKNKKQHIAVLLIAFFMVIAILPSFAKRKKIMPQNAIAEKALSSENQRRYDYFFLEAVRQQAAGNYSAAFDLLSHCLEINPNAPEAYYLQASYFSALKQDSLALRNLEKAASLNPDNSTYLERIAQYYSDAEDYNKAIDAYEQLASRHRDRTDVLNVLLNLYQQNKNYDKMIATINRIEQVEGSSEEIALSKMRVYEMKNDKKAAYNALKSLSDEHPNDLNYKVMLGNWLMQNDKQKEAYKIFSDALKDEPGNTYVLSSLYDYYKSQKQDSIANKYLEQILMNPNTDAQSKTSMMREVINDNEQHGGDSTQVLGLFDRVMAKNPKDSTMAELTAAYMSLKKMPESVINKALYRVLDISPDNAQARVELIQSYWLKQSWDTVAVLSKQGTEYNPDEILFCYFLGMASYQKKENEKALSAFQRGVREATSKSNPDVVSDSYALMGEIYHELGKTKEMYEAFDSCLQWKSDNIGCLNNYAYYLSILKGDLSKAEQMSYRTIKAEPKNATYLDTYAWILFKQDRYKEAKIYIDQALKNDTDTAQSAVIIEHAGDIYYKNNDVPAALDYWQKALKAGGDNPLLPKKIKLKQYIKENE